jgi:hypothetical protein
MNTRRAIVGAGLLCMLACAFAAPNASAAGLRTYTCTKNEGITKNFTDAHCQNGVGPPHPGGLYGLQEVTVPLGNTSVYVTNERTAGATTARTPSRLEGTVSGFETAIECTTVESTGAAIEFSEEWGEGSGKLEYTGCSVTKPAGIGCAIKGSAVTTEKLEASTKGEAEVIKVTPFTGTKLASITIEGCSTSALNKTFPVTGSLLATPNGAMTTTTHAGITGQGTLILAGQVAGLESAATAAMNKPAVDGEAIVARR